MAFYPNIVFVDISKTQLRVNRAKVIAFFVRVNRAKVIAFFDYSGFVECLKLSE